VERSMSRRRTARRAKAGLPPGSLVHVGDLKSEQTRLGVFDYDATSLHEVPAESLAGCLARKAAPTVTWVNVDGLHDVATVEKIGASFGIHPLALEDILNTETRAKFESYDEQLFLVVKMLSWDEAAESIVAEQVSMVLGANYVLTFQEQGGDVFDPVRERLRTDRGRLRRMGADYLLYRLLDAVVDNYFLILEKLDDRIEALEEELTESPTAATLQHIHRLKREMIFLRRAVWPLREVASALARAESELVGRETRLFLRDIHDHSVQVVETVETFRDLLAGMLDVYLSNINNRMNAVMKVLTIIATIFIPLTFVAGVYGMNFHYMPELTWRWGYPVVLLGMFAIGLGMLAAFKRRGWF
jgi:magnesium transporter